MEIEKQTSLRTKGTVVMILVLVQFALLAVCIFLSTNFVTRAFQETIEEVTDEMHPIMNLQTLLYRSAMPLHDFLIHGNPSEAEQFHLLSIKIDRAFEDALTKNYSLQEERSLLEEALQEWKSFRDLNKSMLDTSEVRNRKSAAFMMETSDRQMQKIVNLLDQNHNLIMKEMNEHLLRSQRTKDVVYSLVVIVFIISLGIVFAIGSVLNRSILQPVRELEKAARQFGEGKLESRVEVGGNDEVGSLTRTFNIMAKKIRDSQEMLKDMASRDSLTELYNHRELMRRVREEIRRSSRYGHSFTLLLLDLDRFKFINDQHGHQAGDRVLQQLASLLIRTVRPVDQVARYGGDEFAIILPETEYESAMKLSERVRAVVASFPFETDKDLTFHLTVSVGAGNFPKDGKSAKEIVKVADSSLLNAKRAGRNRVVGSES